jgi:hypothetical protein
MKGGRTNKLRSCTNFFLRNQKANFVYDQLCARNFPFHFVDPEDARLLGENIGLNFVLFLLTGSSLIYLIKCLAAQTVSRTFVVRGSTKNQHTILILCT